MGMMTVWRLGQGDSGPADTPVNDSSQFGNAFSTETREPCFPRRLRSTRGHCARPALTRWPYLHPAPDRWHCDTAPGDEQAGLWGGRPKIGDRNAGSSRQQETNGRPRWPCRTQPTRE